MAAHGRPLASRGPAPVRHCVPMGPLNAQAGRLEAAVGTIVDMRVDLEAAGPWAPAEMYGTEAEASWGAPELLAHLDEMLPYWLGEVERILDGTLGGQNAAVGAGGGPVPFGRTADDPIRIGVIGRDRAVPIRELLSRLDASGRRVAARMRELSAAEVTGIGVHPTRGEIAIPDLFERFVTAHIEDHVAQLRAILATRGV